MPEMWEMEQRRYSIAGEGLPPPSRGMVHSTSEDLHAWSIYRQNLNSDFTDSALGSSEKSPLPYGNFQLRESTVQSILNHPRYGPKSPLGANMYTYLKFGLPRVFPPKEGGNSSGYNSSNEGGGNNGGGAMPHMRKHSRLVAPPQRSTSEADFTHLHYRHPALGHGKSLSQADLLSTETIMRQAAASHRRSLHDLRHTDYLHQALLRQPPPPHHHSQHHMHNHYPQRHHQNHQSQRTRRSSAAVTAQTQPPSHIEPFSFSTLHPQQYSGLYPHIQLRNMNVRSKKGEPMVNNLSTEVKAGEILSIMATNSEVGTCILETLAGRHPYSGQILLNGLEVGAKELRRVAAIVRKTTVLHGDLTVSGTLRYYASLRRPSIGSRGKLSTVDQVAIVTDELGLSPVLDTRVSELTPSEESRLIVALQLLSDPQLLLVDDVTQPMDIFDAFFLVEFLRYWAAGATGGVTGRIVIMCLQPPTYEILTMVSRLLILSGSDTMYDGPSRALTHYFTPVQCPAPAYKNPADYYLDLVTLDDLSAEAMLESSQRVDQLAALYRRRQAPLTDVPPYTLPSPFSTLWFTSQAFILLLKDCFYSQPVSFSRWILRVIVAAVISVIVGSVFWDVPSSDPQLSREERLGFHFTILAVTSWPLAMSLGLARTHGREREATESDIALGLYSRLVYIISMMIFSILPSSLVWLSYLIPAYCMSGLYDQSFTENLFTYIGQGLLCLLSLQWTCTAIGYMCPNKAWSTLLYTVLHVVLSSSTGFPLYSTDALAQLGPFNPLGVAYSAVVSTDHSPAVLRAINSRLVCRNKQVQRQDIIVHLPCPVPNGTQALMSHGLLPSTTGGHILSPSLLSTIWLLIMSLIITIFFLIAPLLYKKTKPQKDRSR